MMRLELFLEPITSYTKLYRYALASGIRLKSKFSVKIFICFSTKIQTNRYGGTDKMSACFRPVQL